MTQHRKALPDLTREVQGRVGVTEDGIWGVDTATAVLAKIPPPAASAPLADFKTAPAVAAGFHSRSGLATIVTPAPGYALGPKSIAELKGVHPDLVRLVRRAIEITTQDFSVHDGLRTEAEQREYVRRGVSKTMNSKHMKQADGFGHAVDLVPFINGQLRWEWKPIYAITAAVRRAAEELGVKLIWGGVWDKPFEALPADAKGIEQAVNSYVARRRAVGKTAFIDGPHFELAR